MEKIATHRPQKLADAASLRVRIEACAGRTSTWRTHYRPQLIRANVEPMPSGNKKRTPLRHPPRGASGYQTGRQPKRVSVGRVSAPTIAAISACGI